MHKTTRMILASALLSLSSPFVFAAGPAATIDQLSWMTGTYAGMLGANQLEENWIKAEGRSIAAMVRMTTGEGATSMFEMITIEEVDGSLVLHIQQWKPGLRAAHTRAAENGTVDDCRQPRALHGSH